MCGLFFSVGIDAPRACIEALSHRGPDGQSWDVQDLPVGRLSLGHTRLAIIDLDRAADQPFDSADGRYRLLYNGMIYNYVELRQTLEAEGCVFRTQSDTEVLLHALVQWGPQALPKLAGMFAFVLYDQQTGHVTLGRDAFGIKPLFIHTALAGGVALASEIKAFVPLPTFRPRLNRLAAFDFLEHGLTDHTDQTLFQTVRHLPAGHYVHTDLQSFADDDFELVQWRSPVAPGSASPKRKGTESVYQHVFDAALLRHMRSDVPVGACLSGGLDSSAIVLSYATLTDDPLTVFHAHQHEPALDESRYARDVVAHSANVDLNMIEATLRDLPDQLRRLVRVQDEPFGSPGILMQYLLFEAASDTGLKVMLDGQGADEMLGGYHAGFPTALAEDILSFRLISFLRQCLGLRQRGLLSLDLIKATIQSVQSRLAQRRTAHTRQQTLRDTVYKTHWLNSEVFQTVFDDGLDRRRFVKCGSPYPEGFDRWCAQLIETTSLPRLLRFEDRNAMAHGIEARVPFVDNVLSALSISLPRDWKLRNGETKYILRRAMADRYPDSIRNRTDKLGFATPLRDWLNGPLRDDVRQVLGRLQKRFPSLINIWSQADLSPESLPDTGCVWRLYMFGLWAEAFDVSL